MHKRETNFLCTNAFFVPAFLACVLLLTVYAHEFCEIINGTDNHIHR